jgi:hypothetical protein
VICYTGHARERNHQLIDAMHDQQSKSIVHTT